MEEEPMQVDMEDSEDGVLVGSHGGGMYDGSHKGDLSLEGYSSSDRVGRFAMMFASLPLDQRYGRLYTGQT